MLYRISYYIQNYNYLDLDTFELPVKKKTFGRLKTSDFEPEDFKIKNRLNRNIQVRFYGSKYEMLVAP